VYHITQRAPGKEKLFIVDNDYLFMISLIKKASEAFKLNTFAFCLMPNHVHLLLRTKENNLVVAMKSVFEQYARYFNRTYLRKGHVFCGPFAAALCSDNEYFLTISL
jgi:putative transposase